MPVEIIAAVISVLGVVVLGFVGWLFRGMLIDLRTIKLDVAVMNSKMGDTLKLKEDVASDHDRIVRLEVGIEAAQKDIGFYHSKIRETNSRIDNLISEG